MSLLHRDYCPACLKVNTVLRVDLPFGEPPIRTYLEEFYRPYPRCDFSELSAERFQLAECRVCGCLYQVRVPGPGFLGRFYGEGLRHCASQGGDAVQTFDIEQQMRELMMVIRFLQRAEPRPRVLDFGTGDGGWAMLALASGLPTSACDISTHAFSRLKACGITCFQPEELPVEAFDFIHTEQVFEHLTSPAEALSQLARALRPGGVLQIGVPHDPALRKKLLFPDWTAPKHSPDSLNAVAPIEHLNHFEPESLRAMAAGGGLTPLAVSGWALMRTAELEARRGPKSWAGLWLRKRLREVHSPRYALAQTLFFEKPSAHSEPGQPNPGRA